MYVSTVIDTKMVAEDSGYLNIPLWKPYGIHGTPPTAVDVPDCKSPGTIQMVSEVICYKGREVIV